MYVIYTWTCFPSQLTKIYSSWIYPHKTFGRKDTYILTGLVQAGNALLKLISWSFLLSVLLVPTVEQPSEAQTALLLDEIQSGGGPSPGEQTGTSPEA